MPPPTETLTRPEQRERSYRSLRGVQTRFLLADQSVLNPTVVTCPPDSFTNVSSFEERDYTIFERASRGERLQYWQEKNLSGDQAKQAWTTQTEECFNRSRNTRIFQGLSPLLTTIGMSPQGQEFVASDIDKIWQRYFVKQDGHEPGGVKKFVTDILASYQGNVPMESISWMSNLFGKEKAAEVVSQLVDAEANLLANPQFVQQHKEEANHLSEKEKGLLAFLHGDVQASDQRRDRQDQLEGDTQRELPILAHTQEIKEKIQRDDCVIIVGGTGCGKTIGTPPMIREIMQPGDKLIVTEPRQINAKDLATTVAENAGVTVGQEIGYQHGGGSEFSDRTDTLFTTEGTLIQKILADPLLSDTTHVMVDEVHVRSTDTEQLLRYLKEAQHLRRERGMKPLKIIAASATVDKRELANYLTVQEDRIVNVAGERRFGIEKSFSTRDIPKDQMPQAAAEALTGITNGNNVGDVMIFVAGTGEIESTEQAILAKNLSNIRIIKLHANADESEKEESRKDPTPGVRRVIIATNFAETGLTVPGLKFVINTGEEYERTVDPVSGLEYIRKIKQAKAGATQREGRVGRRSKGIVINLFTEADYNARPDYPTPEIKRTDLTDLVLKMKKRGIQNFAEFQVLSSPLDERRMTFANESLRKLGATNPDGTLTRLGERMIELPTDLHFARMIAEAERRGRGIEQLSTIVALADTRGLFLNDQDHRVRADQTRRAFQNQNSDYLTYFAIWKAFQSNGESPEWAESHGLNFQKLMMVKETRDRLISRSRGAHGVEATDEELEEYIVSGLTDRVMKYNATRRSYVWEVGNVDNINLQIGRRSALYGTTPEYIVAADNSELRQQDRIVFLSNCQRVKPEWI